MGIMTENLVTPNPFIQAIQFLERRMEANNANYESIKRMSAGRLSVVDIEQRDTYNAQCLKAIDALNGAYKQEVAG
jgi:hypothetical protein